LRSLTSDLRNILPDECIILTDNKPYQEECNNKFTRNLNELKTLHHSQCLFNRLPPVIPDLSFNFDNDGILHGEFTCSNLFQGYDEMMHGGIIAAIIDASMAKCLMGHRVVAYTAELKIKYRKHVMINKKATLCTTIKETYLDKLYIVHTEIHQNSIAVVTAKAKFFKAQEIKT